MLSKVGRDFAKNSTFVTHATPWQRTGVLRWPGCRMKNHPRMGGQKNEGPIKIHFQPLTWFNLVVRMVGQPRSCVPKRWHRALN